MAAVEKLQQVEAKHIICYKGKQMVGLLPVYEKTRLGCKSLKSPLGSYYQGMNIWLDEASSEARKGLDTLQITQSVASFISERYRRVKINLCPQTVDLRGFTWSKLKAIPLYTYVTNTSEQIHPIPDERRKLERAKSVGYHFGEKHSPADFIELVKNMNGRKQRDPGFTYDRFAVYLETLNNAGIIRQFNLYLDSEIVSSNILIMDGAKAYSVFRATKEEALKLGASSLHTVELIKQLNSEGIESLDFCGGNVPDVARFKAAMGLRLQGFFQIQS